MGKDIMNDYNIVTQYVYKLSTRYDCKLFTLYKYEF